MRQNGSSERLGTKMGTIVLPCFAFVWPPMVQTAAVKTVQAPVQGAEGFSSVRNGYGLGTAEAEARREGQHAEAAERR